MEDKNKIKEKNKFKRGFTLIETFVAISILLIAITGPLYLVTRGLAISKVAKGQITAMFLAQEAVEYIRNVRDENILNGVSWTVNLENCLIEGQKCRIDSTNPDIETISCGGSECLVLEYNPASHQYNYDGEQSLFRRDIELIQIPGDKEIEIVVDMYWNEGPLEHQFTIREHLLNWQ
ncbi:MAG: prepilin-type N-terminal cleavage/methylation domain-containing protein [Candidatus Pacebacteria bacterium]|nr:prepilin-type N-terminal cleavage/methylation domain-containing protein [Candidatus Paceibacterota bacterium]